MIRVLPPTPLGALARPRRTALPFPLDDSGCALFARGRHGLWQGVQALSMEPGDEVLVPAYHHGSEVEALIAAGLRCRFYDAGPTLEPDAAELDRLVNERVRALHLIHYLGFPQDLAKWRAWCDERGLLLLEDAAQAWFAHADGVPVGSVGDLAIFCLYKAIGVPDGAALIVNAPTPRPESSRERGVERLARGQLAWILQHSNGLGKFAARRKNGRSYVAAEDFALGDPGSPPTAVTSLLLPRLADEHVAAMRRANYRILLDELGGRVAEPFGTVPDGASPFAFPVETDDKRRLLERLAAQSILGVDFWSEPHPSLPGKNFPAAASRRERVVALPVHHQLRPGDLKRITAAVQGPSVRRPDLRFTLRDSFDAAESSWGELAEGSANVFSTPEWAHVWWHHFGRGRRLVIGECRDRRGRTVALLPMYLAVERPLRMLRFIGHGPGDQLGPVCAPESRARVGHAFGRALDRREFPWDVFLGEQLPGGEGWAALLGATTLGREGNPALQPRGRPWEQVLASLSPKLRQELRYHERRLTREHDVRFELCEDPERLAHDLDMLFHLHEEQWGSAGSAFSGRREGFHREFARAALDRGWLRLWFLQVDGKPIAAKYNFRYAGVEFSYQAGRERAWNRYSVGVVVLARALRQAVEDGVAEYRFLRGGERYKYRFANVDPGLETVGAARGAFAGLLLAAGARLREVPALAQLGHRVAD